MSSARPQNNDSAVQDPQYWFGLSHSQVAGIWAVFKAATLSGFPADLLTFPLFRIKTVHQTQGAAKEGMQQLGGITHSIKEIYRSQGFKGYYRGLAPVLAGSIPGTILFFMGVEATKALGGKEPWVAGVSGFVGQATGSLFWVPSSVTAEIAQMPQPSAEFKDKKGLALVKQIVAKDGLRGLYRGAGPQYATFAACNALGSALADYTFKRRATDAPAKAQDIFAIYAVSFYLAAGITNPIDVIKTRVQVARANPQLFPDRGFFKCAKNTVKNEGLKSLTAGASFRALWLGGRQGLAFTGFKLLSDHFNEENREKAPSLKK